MQKIRAALVEVSLAPPKSNRAELRLTGRQIQAHLVGLVLKRILPFEVWREILPPPSTKCTQAGEIYVNIREGILQWRQR